MDSNPDLTENIILHRVPGIFNPKYFSKIVPSILSITVENWDFVLAHTVEDLKKSNIIADFYLFGHTHKPDFYIKNKTNYLNPGHLKNKFDRGFEASYCILKVSKNKLVIKIFTISGNLYFEKTLKK